MGLYLNVFIQNSIKFGCTFQLVDIDGGTFTSVNVDNNEGGKSAAVEGRH